MSGIGELLGQQGVVVCCGSGGVGKTTVAAAMALSAAQSGRRTCVVTIDPAKRLADALGLASLTNTPAMVEGDWPGELWAMMLDTKGTFDQLIVDNATDRGRAEAILGNRVYRNLSSALSGTQEYMASEKLYQLHEDPRFDLVVVDTPPTRNALDFIEAPRRLVRFLDNRVFRVVMAPTRAYLRAASMATRTALRTMSKVVGSAVVDDAIEFFQAFEGMEDGFRSRAAGVAALLTSAETAFVLVTSPRSDAIAEALYLADRLVQSQITVRQVVVNRVYPRFEEAGGEAGGEPPAPRTSGPLAVLEANLAELRAVAQREEACLAVLAQRVGDTPLLKVPILSGDVHDLVALSELARWLVEPAA